MAALGVPCMTMSDSSMW